MFNLNAVGYGNIISSGQGGVFVRLLFLWKGSLYKLVWLDLVVYLSLYYLLSFLYRFALNADQKTTFEEIVKFCDSMKTNIPISFLLGFFVAGVITRWYQMYMCIPWMNRIAFLAQGTITGNNQDDARRVRLSLMRYMNLAWILLMRNISEQIANRFRTEENQGEEEKSVREILSNINRDKQVQLHYRKIITEHEIVAMENIASHYYYTYRKKYTPEYWIPLQWAVRLLKKAYLHGIISDPRTLMNLIDEVDKVRGDMATLIIYSDVMIPLVYTQVVIIAVYSYFLLHLFAAQFVDPAKKIVGHEVDFYVPIFTIFQFLFLMGWLKVAMCVMNPFGDDDEDFQTSDMLDFNLEISQRSAAAEDIMYPENFPPAQMAFRSQPGAENDNFNDFMGDIDEDLAEVVPNNPLEERFCLSIEEQSKWTRLRNIFSCRYVRKAKKKKACLSISEEDREQDDVETNFVSNMHCEEAIINSSASVNNGDALWSHDLSQEEEKVFLPIDCDTRMC